MKFFHKDDNKKGGKKHQDDFLGDFVKKDKVKILPKKQENRITFINFLNFFPPVELPFTISSDTQRLISQNNDPLAAQWMLHFVLDKDAVVDDFTEYMPCFSLPDTDDFIAIVYWEAGIEGNNYHLVTFSKTGVVIDNKIIAGTKYNSDGLMQMVCTIGEDWMISRVEGAIDEQGHAVPVDEIKSHHHTFLQLTNEGEIVKI